MKHNFPDQILAQHVAIIGKTGSGKTCTAKLAVEQIVASSPNARVCILDPIKSDWWGLTSSADGKSPGLKFNILGGPRGHVALHPQAGAAVGEIVATGQLPLSILDMAEFEMGGLQQFFTTFAPALLRKMRGVLYLVVEEAHEFAPKERGGFGAENMAIHYAKKIAVAGRSKGIRLIIATQRTQALHNAMLGSCDTLIAHRLVAPADQEPVVKWLKANLPPDKAKEVAASLQSLKTGEAWICSGELGLFERKQFPRIATYDNTVTPTEDVSEVEVKTAAVDHNHLREIIGQAVDGAKSNDPRELKKELARLRGLVDWQEKHPVSVASAPIEVPVITDGQMAELSGITSDLGHAARKAEAVVEWFKSALDELKRGKLKPFPIVRPADFEQSPNLNPRGIPARSSVPGSTGVGNGGVRRMLIAIAQRPGITPRQIGIRAGLSSKSGSFSTYLARLRSNQWVTQNGGTFSITSEGSAALGDFQPLPEGEALLHHWLNYFGNNGAGRLLRVIADAYPKTISQSDAGLKANISSTSGSFSTYLSKLRALELVEGRGDLRASDELF